MKSCNKCGKLISSGHIICDDCYKHFELDKFIKYLNDEKDKIVFDLNNRHIVADKPIELATAQLNAISDIEEMVFADYGITRKEYYGIKDES